jgi:hypothetical protein
VGDDSKVKGSWGYVRELALKIDLPLDAALSQSFQMIPNYMYRGDYNGALGVPSSVSGGCYRWKLGKTPTGTGSLGSIQDGTLNPLILRAMVPKILKIGNGIQMLPQVVCVPRSIIISRCISVFTIINAGCDFNVN